MNFITFGLLGLSEQAAIAALAPESLVARNTEEVLVTNQSAPENAVPQSTVGTPQPTSNDGRDSVDAALLFDKPATGTDLAGVDTGLQDKNNDSHGHAAKESAHRHSDDEICDEIHGEVEAALLDNSNVTLGAALLPLDKTFLLHSAPGASKVIYLDFDGHTTTGTTWNDSTMGSSFYSPAFDLDGNTSSFSSTELTLIQNVWQRVVADFAAFDVDVTTQAPPEDWLINSGSGDSNYGVRAVISGYGPRSVDGIGGIAAVNSFRSSKDTPVFIYHSTMLGIANVVSHEVGHSLGLSHDGTSSYEYYSGHGAGSTSWAPIMGTSWATNISSWDNGIYHQSNNTGSTANYGRGADDIAIITGLNGFGFQTDLEGDSQSQAVALQLNGTSISQFGTIQTYWDQDWFRLDLVADSQVSLTFNPYIYRAFTDADGQWGGAISMHTASVNDADTRTSYAEGGTNLDLGIDLLNSNGNLLSSFGTSVRSTLFSQNLTAGTYYFRLDGKGFGDPTSSTPTGYSDYASTGNYLISGTVTPSTTTTTTTTPTATPSITLALSPSSVQEDGATNLLFTFTRSVVSTDPLTVNFTVAGTATNGTDYAGLAAGSNQSVTFAAGAATATVLIDPTADTTVETNETVSLSLAAGTGYSIGTSTAVTGTIANDDVAPTPVITLALSPSSVQEDGATNLLFTFTRSVVSADPLTVNFTVAGTATNGNDYSGLAAGSNQSVTFAAGAATATVLIDPTADTTVETNETVSLSLAAGSGYSIGTSTAVTGTIANDDPAAAQTAFTAGVDVLTGTTAGEQFTVARLSDALWSSTPDRITNLQAGLDVIDSPFNRTTAIAPRLLGAVKTLDAAGITALLTTKTFAKNGASTFTFGSGAELRTFLAVNDGVAGFNAATDSVIEITGFSGSLSSLAIL